MNIQCKVNENMIDTLSIALDSEIHSRFTSGFKKIQLTFKGEKVNMSTEEFWDILDKLLKEKLKK